MRYFKLLNNLWVSHEAKQALRQGVYFEDDKGHCAALSAVFHKDYRVTVKATVLWGKGHFSLGFEVATRILDSILLNFDIDPYEDGHMWKEATSGISKRHEVILMNKGPAPLEQPIEGIQVTNRK